MELIEVDAGQVVFDAADPLGNKAGIYELIFEIIPNPTGEKGNRAREKGIKHGGMTKRRVTHPPPLLFIDFPYILGGI